MRFFISVLLLTLMIIEATRAAEYPDATADDCGVGFGGDGVAVEDTAISTSVDTVTTTGIQGHSTFRIVVHLGATAENCYTIFGSGAHPASSSLFRASSSLFLGRPGRTWTLTPSRASSVALVTARHTVGHQLSFPAAFQCAAPFGVDTGGTSPAFWPVSADSQFDSWLTVGLTDGDTDSKISTIGVDFRAWDEDTALLSDMGSGGAVFWMDPDQATDAVTTGANGDRTMVVAQLTLLSTSASQQARFDAQGRGAGVPANADETNANWEENCITVMLGGAQNGQGSHAVGAPAAPPPPPPSPPPGAGKAAGGAASCKWVYVRNAKTWEDADADCAVRHPGGHLVTVTSAEEQMLLETIIPDDDSGRHHVWIGLNDILGQALGDGDSFTWAGGSDAAYRDWSTGEPNDDETDANCVETGTTAWADSPCSDHKAYVCGAPCEPGETFQVDHGDHGKPGGGKHGGYSPPPPPPPAPLEPQPQPSECDDATQPAQSYGQAALNPCPQLVASGQIDCADAAQVQICLATCAAQGQGPCAGDARPPPPPPPPHESVAAPADSCTLLIGPEPQTWANAEATCASLIPGGHLASITSHEEQDALHALGESHGGGGLWIGLNDIQHESMCSPGASSNFVWSDGSDLQYTNWAHGEPANVYGYQQDRCAGQGAAADNDEDCVQAWHAGASWADTVCEALAKPVCKGPCVNGVASPTPPGAAGEAGGGGGGGGGEEEPRPARCDYRIFHTPRSWEDAEADCASRTPGGHLASIRSLQDLTTLNSLIPPCDHGPCPHSVVWIGFQDRDGELGCNGDFSWSDGSSSLHSATHYTMWAAGMPNCNHENDFDCATMAGADDHGGALWANADCAERKSYVCASPSTPGHPDLCPGVILEPAGDGGDGGNAASSGGCNAHMSGISNVGVVDSAVATSVDTFTTSGVEGFTTYRIKLHLSNAVENCYTIFGTQEHRLSFPPAYQVPAPFGADVGGTSPQLWAVANTAVTGFSQWDSWLTVGIVDGDSANGMSSIGVDFTRWSEDTELLSDPAEGGAVFWMNPDLASQAVIGYPDRTMAIAQLTLATSDQSQTATFAAQGRPSSGIADDWEENCISVKVGGRQNGEGSHAYQGGTNSIKTGPPPPPPPPHDVCGCVPGTGWDEHPAHPGLQPACRSGSRTSPQDAAFCLDACGCVPDGPGRAGTGWDAHPARPGLQPACRSGSRTSPQDAAFCLSESSVVHPGHDSPIGVSATPWLSLYVPSDPDGECELRDIRSKVAELDATCCANDAPGEKRCDPAVSNGAPSTCSAACGAKLVKLYHQCNSTLDKLFDGMDGEYDGVAQTLHDLRSSCLSMPVGDVVDELKRLQDQGCEVDSNGIGRLVVDGAPIDADCQDTGAHTMCQLVTSGALTCAGDFCSDEDECAHARQCDLTCGFCSPGPGGTSTGSASGGNGGGGGGGGGGGHRRSQIDLSRGCTALNLQSKVTPVNEACCDEPGACNGGGGLGVPTVCDAQCAIVYAPFWEECESTLRSSFAGAGATVAAFSDLAHTCNSLPVGDLLETASQATCTDYESPDPPQEGGFGAWLDDQLDCPLAMLEDRAVAIDNACCADDQCQDEGGPSTCSIPCAAPFLSTGTDCTATFNTVLDGMDGTFDGSADVVSNLHDACEGLSPSGVIGHLKTMQDSGCALDSEGVDETAVVSGDLACADTGDEALCSLVNLGVLSCAVDFCPTCTHPNACDATCGYCTPAATPSDGGGGGGGGDGANTGGGGGGGHRRAQINIADTSCDVNDMRHRTEAVNRDCCNESNDHCSSGVPTTCDAKCAITYLSYYSDCSSQIAASFTASQQIAFHELHDTCASLPIEPLLNIMTTARHCPAGTPGAPASTPAGGHQCRSCAPITTADLGFDVLRSSYSGRSNEDGSYCMGAIFLPMCARGKTPNHVDYRSGGSQPLGMSCGTHAPRGANSGAEPHWASANGETIRCT
jgi:hypothetical protein